MKDLSLYDPEICDGEEWKPVVGYEGLYEVSNYGRVRRLKWQLVKPKKEHCGHMRINLYRRGEKKPVLVHRLVAEAFIPNPNNYPVINHKDERPANNRVENLEWCTHKHNANWGTRNKRISENSANKSAVISIDKKTGEKKHYPSISAACKALGVSCSSSISEAASGMRKSAYGKRWIYAEDDK